MDISAALWALWIWKDFTYSWRSFEGRVCVCLRDRCSRTLFSKWLTWTLTWQCRRLRFTPTLRPNIRSATFINIALWHYCLLTITSYLASRLIMTWTRTWQCRRLRYTPTPHENIEIFYTMSHLQHVSIVPSVMKRVDITWLDCKWSARYLTWPSREIVFL